MLELFGQGLKPGKRFLFINFEPIWKNRGFERNLESSRQCIQNTHAFLALFLTKRTRDYSLSRHNPCNWKN